LQLTTKLAPASSDFYTHRKEYARWIEEARRGETRQRRVTQALERLRQGEPRN